MMANVMIIIKSTQMPQAHTPPFAKPFHVQCLLYKQ